MAERLSRRQALIHLGQAGAVMAGASAIAKLTYDRGGFDLQGAQGKRQVRDFRVPKPNAAVDMAIASTLTDPVALTTAAVNALGGMKRFISRGDIVAIKPNIGWDRMAIHAANTNPLVVQTLIKMAYNAGAKNVVVTDASCNDPHRCFQRSGIWKAAYGVGAEVILPGEHRFRGMRLKGEVLDHWPVYTPLIHADKIINVPVAKHHNLAKFTAAMKNWYGVLGGRRNRLHQNIHTSIADLATFMRPTLTVIDATRVLVRNGPQGGNVDDTRVMNQVIATIDQVAGDAYACTLIGEKPEHLGYLKMAAERKIGTPDWQSLNVKKV